MGNAHAVIQHTHTHLHCMRCLQRNTNNNDSIFTFALVAAERSTTIHVVQSLHARKTKTKGCYFVCVMNAKRRNHFNMTQKGQKHHAVTIKQVHNNAEALLQRLRTCQARLSWASVSHAPTCSEQSTPLRTRTWATRPACRTGGNQLVVKRSNLQLCRAPLLSEYYSIHMEKKLRERCVGEMTHKGSCPAALVCINCHAYSPPRGVRHKGAVTCT